MIIQGYIKDFGLINYVNKKDFKYFIIKIDIKDSIIWENLMVKVFIYGKLDKNIKECGLMV